MQCNINADTGSVAADRGGSAGAACDIRGILINIANRVSFPEPNREATRKAPLSATKAATNLRDQACSACDSCIPGREQSLCPMDLTKLMLECPMPRSLIPQANISPAL